MDLPLHTKVASRNVEDADAMAAAMADGLTGEYVQLEARPFTGRWDIVRGHGAVVQFGCEDLALVRRMRVPADRWAFMVPLTMPGSARWNGCAIHGGEIVACAPGSEGYAFDPAGTLFAVISVACAGVPVPIPVLESIVASQESAVVRPVDWRASALRDELLALDAAARAPRAMTDATTRVHLVMAHLARCISPASPPAANLGTGRNVIVRRAEDFFRRHVGEPVSIAQLSAVAGVSERSLRNAFYHVYTTSPKRYLKLWQLHQVRRALRTAEQSQATVTDVATCHGFYELGRFAGEYKALFGERPSQTLQKARSMHTSRAGAA